MPGKVGSASFAVFLIDGYDVLPTKPKSYQWKTESDLEDSTGLGDGTESMLPVGVQKVTISQAGAFFEDSTAGIHLLLSAANALQASRILGWAPEGNANGKQFCGTFGTYVMEYDPAPAVKALTKANVAYQVDNGIEWGQIIQALASKTVDWNTKTDGVEVDYTTDPSQQVIPITSNTAASPSVVTTPIPHGLTNGQKVLISGVSGSIADINGEQVATVLTPTTFSVAVNASTHAGTGGQFVRSNTPNGGAGYQFVRGFSGFSGFIGKIRSSADDITYADLVTFANVTGANNAQRVTCVGTVDRYLCFNGDVTGAGSIEVFVGFHRA